MTHSGRRRRRILGGIALAGGVLLLLLADDPAVAGKAWKGKLFGPAGVFYGLSGLLSPPSVPDPRPDGGAVEAVALMGSPALAVGATMGGLGLVVGAWLAFG